MLPSVRELESVEKIRDGGSLAATYNDGRQSAVLFLKISICVLDDGRWKLVKFEKPVVLGGEPIQWRRPIEWSEARQALACMIRLSEFLAPRDQTLLQIMSQIADLDGSYPSEDEIFKESYQHLTI